MGDDSANEVVVCSGCNSHVDYEDSYKCANCGISGVIFQASEYCGDCWDGGLSNGSTLCRDCLEAEDGYQGNKEN